MGGTQGKVSAADRAGSCGGAGNEGALASRGQGKREWGGTEEGHVVSLDG